MSDSPARYVKLSYDQSASGPHPRTLPPVETAPHFTIPRDGANVFRVTLVTHAGTHLDAPNHVIEDGYRISDFDISDFVFDRPVIVDLAMQDRELFRPGHFEPHAGAIAGGDLLLIRTGSGSFRDRERRRYCDDNPGFSADAARYLRETFPQLRAVGLDTISLAALSALEEGMEAHRVLLGGPQRKFFIFEDLRLPDGLGGLSQVIALPLIVEGTDSGPCTVMGVIRT